MIVVALVSNSLAFKSHHHRNGSKLDVKVEYEWQVKRRMEVKRGKACGVTLWRRRRAIEHTTSKRILEKQQRNTLVKMRGLKANEKPAEQ